MTLKKIKLDGKKRKPAMSFSQRESKREVSYDEKGQIKEKKVSLDGKLHGEYTSYFGNGQIMTDCFCNGIVKGSGLLYKDGPAPGKKAFLTKKSL